MSLAVVGTGTEVGKTVVSAVVLARYASSSQLAYWKPVATGSCDSRDMEEVARLTPPNVEILPETYLFREPFSPHLAARLDGASIDPTHLLAELSRHRSEKPERALVVEGAGGVLVPLTDADLLIDFFAAAHLPCLLVALSGLGTINHTLLSLEALRARRMEIAGVVLNGPPNPENRAAIERFGKVAVLAELSPLSSLDRPAVGEAAESFDRDGRLAPYLLRA